MAATDPFRLDPRRGGGGDTPGVLLLHGFTGSPHEVRPLGERLADAGFLVHAPLLAGHGRTAADLERSTEADWLASAAAGLAELRRRVDRVAVAGLSMGALLTLELCRRDTGVRAAAAIAAPLWLPRSARLALPLARGLARLLHRPLTVPKLAKGGDLRDREERRRNPQLDAFPVAAVAALERLAAGVRRAVPEVTTPLLIAHAVHDHTADPACAAELYARVGARDRRLVLLPRSYHIATLDVDRDLLAGEVIGFFSERV